MQENIQTLQQPQPHECKKCKYLILAVIVIFLLVILLVTVFDFANMSIQNLITQQYFNDSRELLDNKKEPETIIEKDTTSTDLNQAEQELEDNIEEIDTSLDELENSMNDLDNEIDELGL